MKLLVHKSQLFVGESVEFSYNGKPRVGIVHTINAKSFCLKLVTGFKAFCWEKVDGLTEGPCGHYEFGHTGITIL